MGCSISRVRCCVRSSRKLVRTLMEGAEKVLGAILFLTSKVVFVVDTNSSCFLVYFKKGLENWVNSSSIFLRFFAKFRQIFRGEINFQPLSL